MPEILLDPLSIQGNGFFNGVATKIVHSSTAVNGGAIVAPVPYVVLKYVKAMPSSIASVAAGSHKFKTVSGALLSQGLLETYMYDRDVRQSMLDYLPPLYQDFKDFRSLIVSEANEFTRLNAKLEELLMQFFIGTATYSLDDWEKFTGIDRVGQTISIRRDEVKKKVNGIGTVTGSVLKSVVDNFYFSDMTEVPTPGVILFKIKGKRGVPDNLGEMELAVLEVIPAHLQPEYLFTYLTWLEIEQAGLVWVDADTYTHKGLEEAFLVEPAYPYQN